MKSLKVKSIFFSLLTVLAITVSLTSCEQEAVVIPDAEVMEMTAPELPAFVTELEDRACSCDVRVYDINVIDLTSTRKMFTVDTGVYTPGCNATDFFWFTYNQDNVLVHWENGQAMSASFTEPGSYWIGAFLYARDSNNQFCYDVSTVRVTVP